MKKIFEQPVVEVEAFLTEETIMSEEVNPFANDSGMGVAFW